ncbi:MAG: NAD(P)/FAD-dependent oxidoreductase, partial [Novosphingobium sp.]
MLSQADVEQISVSSGRASGVVLADGRKFYARKGVFCSVTPDALYNRMLPEDAVPASHRKKAQEFRFGRADMQIHLALDRPAPWPNEKLARTAMVHVSNGIDEVARAVTLANSGMLPDRPTIVVGQPAVNDPSRMPDGKGLLWLQLQELPRHVKGDAAGVIDVPANGVWTRELAEAYADRVIDRLDALAPGIKTAIVKRVVLSPLDIEAMNCNLVGGDPYAGDCALDQSFLWRPIKTSKTHRTPVKNLFHIGASTHPGPGLGGISGVIA